MKIYSRNEIRQLLPGSNLKGWCNDQGIYYHGVVRFLKGGDISLVGYFDILKALEIHKGCEHYIGKKLNYEDLREIERFCKKVLFM